MSEEYTEEGVGHLLAKACDELYSRYKHLVLEAAHERSIVGDVLAVHLRSNITNYDVTTEYNREGEMGDREPKTDSEGNRIIPDIIIHKFGPKGPNIAAIQVKGYWNHEDRKRDEELLKKLQDKHGYQFLFRLELRKDGYDIISVY